MAQFVSLKWRFSYAEPALSYWLSHPSLTHALSLSQVKNQEWGRAREKERKKRKKRRSRSNQTSTPQGVDEDPHLQLHSWVSSRNPLFILLEIFTQSLTLDFSMHGWMKKVVSCFITSRVSSRSSLINHLMDSSNSFLMVFARDSWFWSNPSLSLGEKKEQGLSMILVA